MKRLYLSILEHAFGQIQVAVLLCLEVTPTFLINLVMKTYRQTFGFAYSFNRYNTKDQVICCVLEQVFINAVVACRSTLTLPAHSELMADLLFGWKDIHPECMIC